MKDRPPNHPWDGFLVGPENDLAHAGVLALARDEAAGMSPLVVHGPSGSGKTRLMEGLIAEKIARSPGASVALLGAEAFVALCAEAANRLGGFAEVRARFRGLDLLVLDDLHALEGASMAQAELTHTLDALEEAGASVAATARTGPGRWSGWAPRLVSRLIGGLSVRVELPGSASRRRYVLEKSRAAGLVLSAPIVESLAGSSEEYRSLDGQIARLVLARKVTTDPMDATAMAEVVAGGEDGSSPSPRVALDRITTAVAGRFGLKPRDLRSASRRQALVVPRHLAILLARRWTGASFATLGDYFGKRDPASIRHACKAAADRLAADPALAAEAAAIEPPARLGPAPRD